MRAYSNQDIEEIISKDKSVQEKSISDLDHEDMIKRSSEGSSVSPYISELISGERQLSLNSLEGHERYSEVFIQKNELIY